MIAKPEDVEKAIKELKDKDEQPYTFKHEPWLKEIYSKNPCGEIALGNPEPVVPWVQIQLMNHFRVKSGKPPFTAKEIEDITKILESQNG